MFIVAVTLLGASPALSAPAEAAKAPVCTTSQMPVPAAHRITRPVKACQSAAEAAVDRKVQDKNFAEHLARRRPQ